MCHKANHRAASESGAESILSAKIVTQCESMRRTSGGRRLGVGASKKRRWKGREPSASRPRQAQGSAV